MSDRVVVGTLERFRLKHLIREFGPRGATVKLGLYWSVLATCLGRKPVSARLHADIKVMTAYYCNLDLPTLYKAEQDSLHKPTLTYRAPVGNRTAERVCHLVKRVGATAACKQLGVSWTVLLSAMAGSDIRQTDLHKIESSLSNLL